MEYLVYAIIGIGLGVSASSIVTRNSKRVQNAKDDLDAKKEWVRMVSSQTKIGARK
jgi:hypothetical protein